MTQADLANKLGLHYKSISDYERDRSEPDDETKKFFASFFNVSLDYLMGLTNERVPLDRKNDFVLPDGFPSKYKPELYTCAELLILKDKYLDRRK